MTIPWKFLVSISITIGLKKLKVWIDVQSVENVRYSVSICVSEITDLHTAAAEPIVIIIGNLYLVI